MSPIAFRPSFQVRFFVTAFSAAVLALAVAGLLFTTTMRRQTDARIEATLRDQVRLAAELIARSKPAAVPEIAELDEEADRLGQLTAARVTFIAADGSVVGDSSEPLAALATMENHAHRPEVIDAREKGLGRAQRYSATLKPQPSPNPLTGAFESDDGPALMDPSLGIVPHGRRSRS